MFLKSFIQLSQMTTKFIMTPKVWNPGMDLSKEAPSQSGLGTVKPVSSSLPSIQDLAHKRCLAKEPHSSSLWTVYAAALWKKVSQHSGQNNKVLQ